LSRLPRLLAPLALACLASAWPPAAHDSLRSGTAVPGTAVQAAPPPGAPATALPAQGAPRAALDSAYLALLEKVNDQLSLRWGPLEVVATLIAAVVAVLGLVFAGGTVMAGWLLYRQSREFREQSEQSIREHRAILGAIVETWRRETDAAFEAKMAEYDKSIVDQQAKLDALTGASAEQREQVERDIERLKRERDAASASELEKLGGAGATPGLGGFTGTFSVPGRRMSGFLAAERHRCTTCGRELPLPELPAGTAEHAIPGTREVFCAHCGAKNRV
jgi:hypothetical protein